MVLDMRPMLRGEVSQMNLDFQLTPEPPDGVEFSGDAHVVGEITDQAGYMHLTLTASVPYSTLCARCLAPVNDTFSVSLERTVAAKENLSEKQLEENVDEYAVVEKGKLDLDDLIREEILLSFPMRVLCSPDCKGLCPICGKSLNDGDCGCVKKEVDPRLAVLRDLLEQDDGQNNQ